jgi:hypothetical protein
VTTLRTLGDIWAETFTKRSKLWRSARDWKPQEWVRLKTVLDRGEEKLGGVDIACYDLHQHLVNGRIESALYHLYNDRAHQLLLRPTFWQGLHIRRWRSSIRVEGTLRGVLLSGGSWAFFARGVDSDKYYPVANPVRDPAPVRNPVIVQPPLRRRGPATTHDWFAISAEIACRCIEAGRVRVPENESKLADEILQRLEDQDLGQPAESEMREAVRRMCAALRTVQK